MHTGGRGRRWPNITKENDAVAGRRCHDGEGKGGWCHDGDVRRGRAAAGEDKIASSRAVGEDDRELDVQRGSARDRRRWRRGWRRQGAAAALRLEDVRVGVRRRRWRSKTTGEDEGVCA